jgi:hypothetical protein
MHKIAKQAAKERKKKKKGEYNMIIQNSLFACQKTIG